MKIEVREVSPSRMTDILPLVERWNAGIEPDVLRGRLSSMMSSGYRCIAAYDQTEIVGISGFWVGCQFWCGKFIQPDNVIVDESRRGQGIGHLLMAWLHSEGKRLGCDVAVLDSYVKLLDSHRFYEKLGYEKLGYHFLKPL